MLLFQKFKIKIIVNKIIKSRFNKKVKFLSVINKIHKMLYIKKK